MALASIYLSLVATGHQDCSEALGDSKVWGALSSVRIQCFPPLPKAGRRAKERTGLE